MPEAIHENENGNFSGKVGTYHAIRVIILIETSLNIPTLRLDGESKKSIATKALNIYVYLLLVGIKNWKTEL